MTDPRQPLLPALAPRCVRCQATLPAAEPHVPDEVCVTCAVALGLLARPVHVTRSAVSRG